MRCPPFSLSLVALAAACSEQGFSSNKDEGHPIAGEDSGGGGSNGGENPTDSGEDPEDPIDEGGDDDSGDRAPPDGPFDVFLVLDAAYSYSCYHPEIGPRSRELIAALFDTGADVRIGVGTYDDYNIEWSWYAAWGGLPFVLVHQVSDDADSLAAAVGGLEMAYGGDDAGSGYEALTQAMTGLGYDQECDGTFTTDQDIRPFKKSSSDAFGGAVDDTYDASVSGTGTQAGVGWRPDAKHVLVFTADNQVRDRDLGDTMPTGTCFDAASRPDALAAINGDDAGVLGINVYEYQDSDPTLQSQLEALADSTGSRIDADGDGAEDDRAVLYGSWDWPPTATIVDAVLDLAD